MKPTRLFLALACAGLAAANASPASAATGLAYDSVTKMLMGADAASQQPGDFDADFKAASEVKSSDGGGGIFAKAQQAMQGAMAMMRTGSAERHYVAGSKERTDQVAQQQATITDCAVRTITTLDLRKKTYRVESLDELAKRGSSGSHDSGGSPTMSDDGTKVAIALTTTALGQKQIGGDATTGYKSDMKMTTTKPGGESHTADMLLTAYYSATSRPSVSCPGSPLAALSGGPRASAVMGSYALAMRALAARSGDSRFSVSSSGPSLPAGKLALFELMTFQQGQGFGILSERGNVRSIGDGDPIFSVPGDFTKEQ